MEPIHIIYRKQMKQVWDTIYINYEIIKYIMKIGAEVYPSLVENRLQQTCPQIKLENAVINKSRAANCNTIFYQSSTNTIYIPVYLRVLLKNVVKINLSTLQALLNLTIVLNTFTYELPENIRDFINQNIQIDFKRDERVKLSDDFSTVVADYKMSQAQYKFMLQSLQQSRQEQKKRKIKQRQSQKQQESSQMLFGPKKISTKISLQKRMSLSDDISKSIKVGKMYTLRKSIHAFLQPYAFFCPFQTIDIVLSISVKKIRFVDEKTKEYCEIKFNLMDRIEQNPESITKRINLTSSTSFSSYIIATKKMFAEYTRNRESKTLMQLGRAPYSFKLLDVKREEFEEPTLEQIKDKHIQFAHFHIPIYKNPLAGLTTLFVPLWLFSAISIAVFFVSPSMADRIAVLATVMIAFVNLILVVREQIPITPILTFFQIMVFFQLITTVLCLAQSFLLNDYDPTLWDYFMRNYHGLEDPLFVAAVVITLLVIFVPILMYCIYFIGHFKGINTIDIKKSQGIDNSFEKWVKNSEADVAFLNDQYLADIMFVNDENFEQQLIMKLKEGYQCREGHGK